MTDVWTNRLSDYMDDELSPSERSALEQHLAGCEACRATVAALAAVIAEAHALQDEPPSRDLWPGVAATIDRAPRRVVFSMSQLIAASVFIALVSGLTVWVAMGRDALAPAEKFAAAVAAPPAAQVVPVASAPYDRAVTDLLQSLDEGRKHLDPKTIEVLERSLGAIDRAIGDASAALDSDPNNVFLTTHLARERQRKLALLRQAQELSARLQ
jgi:hypothetical protein